MNVASLSKYLILGSSFLALAACSSGGGGGSGGGGAIGNSAPVANAGANQSVDEQTAVTLDGSASSDPDGDTLGYSWTQTAGVTVTLANAFSAQASFDSPDVGIGSSTSLTFQLRVTDGNGGVNTTSVEVTVNGVSNTDPVVNAGSDQAAAEGATVSLTGTATDNDIGDALSYSWTQVSGISVTIMNGDQSAATFEAPLVGAAIETLTFELAVNDGTATVTDLITITVSEASAAVNISGKVQYEFVPPNFACRGLDFAATETRPIRAATVQLIEDATGNVLDAIVAAENGDYAFTDVTPNTEVRVRIRAELKRSGAPSWDVEVRDNVDTSPNPPPLGSRPLYAYEESFNSGLNADLVRDITATTGWDGSAYSGTRAAAPFAILDTIYAGMQLVLTADADADFGPLDAFWSVNNTLVSPTDIDNGELSSSFYRGDLDSLFLLGDADVDTEEFDDHVNAHEWGHYFEDVFSRSDSVGGSWSISQNLDARLAFGEGWAQALASMALDDPLYCDTGPAGTSGGFGINSESLDSGLPSPFNPGSVTTLLYDLFDTNVDGSDDSSIGFGPIYATMTGPQSSTAAFTSLFSFATELRSQLNATDQAFLDSQLIRENIDVTGLDIWGSGQVNVAEPPNQAQDVLPLYTTLAPDGNPVNVCLNSDYDSRRDGNKLAQYRYLRFDIAEQRPYRIVATTVSADGNPPSEPPPAYNCITAFQADPDDPEVHTYSDPDFRVLRNGVQQAFGFSCTPNQEELTTGTLIPGTYVMAVTDYRVADEDTIAGYPNRICIDVTVTPN
ncbi:MAG: PKD domain-containing protein [Gammaproteobacteria bacterium]|nr:PKD domain-containing protein [Gammaproteobacteria bacterium]